MIQVIAGDKGSGKTKKMIAIANDFVQQSRGHVIYISNNSEAMYELNSSIRLIDVSQFPISTVDSFIGFIYGIVSEDYDIEHINIDNLNTIIKDEEETLSKFFDAMKKLSSNHGVNFVFGMKTSKNNSLNYEAEYIAV